MAICETGLGNQTMLTKIDKLRELNIGTLIPLPQIAVLGDQSSGKSSLLESLTGFSFPRGTGLCTQYVTQITCSRALERSVFISIIPRPDANETLKARLLRFQRRITEIENDELAKIFEEANLAMGIRIHKADEDDFAMGNRMFSADEDDSCGAFSQDILKIEISGPDQDHFTVIDIPGLFRYPTPGLTTDSDIIIVENMVKSYMSDRRTIILAVIPCTTDLATQEILKLAEAADPSGVRTMGVLTKADLATERTTQNGIISLVLGKGSNLKLGYYVVMNRGADDSNSSVSDRVAKEKALFMGPPWSSIGDRCGISCLKARIRDLLMSLSKQEIPHVKSEIEQRLLQCRADLEMVGPSRGDQGSQRLYLGRLASKFQSITQAALNGYYMGDETFNGESTLKLVTKIIKLNEVFSNVLWKRGHKQHFGPQWDDDGEKSFGRSIDDFPFEVPFANYPDLDDILTEDYQCPLPTKGPILSHIKEVFESSRGPELGTFGGSILGTVFKEQSEKWESLVLAHTSKAIVLVHDYIFQLLTKLCPEKQVREQLWSDLLMDKLRHTYRQAMSHARFLLAIERESRPTTFNHYFNASLQKKRGERMSRSLKAMAISFDCDPERYVPVRQIDQYVVDKDNGQQVCEDILDTLESYYKVSRKRFVDMICQQVVLHFLLEGDKSPLNVLCPDLILSLDFEQLEKVAGEDEETKRHRQVLVRKIESLEAGVKVLRA